MSTNNDYGLLEASEVNLEIIERLLLEHGFEAEIDSTWIQVKMPLFGVFINVMDSIPLLDLAGAISLRGDVTLEETLRFINQLNNRIAGVGFSLWEPIDEAMTDRGLIDLGDLWASIALPIGSGFSARQFIATFELLIGALDHAFGAAVEAGMADPVAHPSNQEVLSHGI